MTVGTPTAQARPEATLHPVHRRRPRIPLPYLLLLPAIVVIAATTLYPFGYAIYLSLNNYDPTLANPLQFTGLDNYARLLFHDPEFWHSLGVTIIFVVLSVGFELLAGIGMALYLNRAFVGKRFLLPLLYLPMIATPVVVGLIWRMLLDPSYGVVNYVFGLVHLGPFLWYSSVQAALPTLILVDFWEWTPFVFLIVYSGLLAMPTEPFEAAEIDGAGKWAAFRYLTLPLLRPVLLVAILIRMMDAFKVFDIVNMLTEGGPGNTTNVLTYNVYLKGFQDFDLGYASALSVVMFVIILIVTRMLLRQMRWRENLR